MPASPVSGAFTLSSLHEEINMAKKSFDRRAFLASGAALVASPALAQDFNGSVEIERDISPVIRRNASSFRTLDWQGHFSNLNKGAILVVDLGDMDFSEYVETLTEKAKAEFKWLKLKSQHQKKRLLCYVV